MTGTRLLSGLLFLSGACALIYELIWMKRLTLQFGSSSWSVATVTASFMAGLALGSALGGRLGERVRRPLLALAALELGIACFGLASPWSFGLLDRIAAPLYAWLDGRAVPFAMVRFALSFALLLPPTLLMGATLPVLAGHAAGDREFQSRVAWLYAANTLGGAAGVLAAAFWLLPRLGLDRATASIGLAGLVLSAAAGLLGRRAHGQTPPAASTRVTRTVTRPALLLAVAALAGLVSLSFEVCWTRLLAPIFGSASQAFAVLLATYLLGIAAGGMAAATRLAPPKAHRAGLGGLLAIAGATSTAGLFLLDRLPLWFAALAQRLDSPAGLFAAQALLAGMLMLVPCLAFGALLPLAAGALAAESGRGPRAVGRIVAANTAGAVAGAVLTGFLLMPGAGPFRLVRLGSLLLLAAGATLFALERRMRPAPRRRGTLVALGLLLLFLLAPPVEDPAALHRGRFRRVLSGRKPAGVSEAADLLYLRHGINAGVAVYRTPDLTSLAINGKTDASTGRDMQTQYLLGHLPLFLHDSPRRVCVLGYGSGATVRAVATHPEVKKIDVLELEPAVLGASRFFRSINEDVLDDPRVEVHLEDGRTFLRYRRRRYDVIVSEPSNPWVAGTAALFTREFYQRVKQRLEPGGRFCQWIQLYEISRSTLDGMLTTLADSFAHVLVFLSTSDLICVASDQPVRIPLQSIERRMAHKPVHDNLARIDVRLPLDLLCGLAARFPADRARYTGRMQTDDNLWIEHRAPIEMYRGRAASLTPRPAAEYLHTLTGSFPSQEPQGELLPRLAASLERRMPEQAELIENLATLLPDGSDRRKVKQLARLARRRLRTILDRPRLLGEAVRLIARSKPDEAIARIRPVLAARPTDGAAHRLMGDACRAKGLPSKAILHYKEAIRLEPLDYLSRTDLALLLLDSGKLTAAHGELRAALRTNPSFVDPWVALLGSLRRTGREQEAALLQADARRLLPPQRHRALIRRLARPGQR